MEKGVKTLFILNIRFLYTLGFDICVDTNYIIHKLEQNLLQQS